MAVFNPSAGWCAEIIASKRVRNEVWSTVSRCLTRSQYSIQQSCVLPSRWCRVVNKFRADAWLLCQPKGKGGEFFLFGWLQWEQRINVPTAVVWLAVLLSGSQSLLNTWRNTLLKDACYGRYSVNWLWVCSLGDISISPKPVFESSCSPNRIDNPMSRVMTIINLRNSSGIPSSA